METEPSKEKMIMPSEASDQLISADMAPELTESLAAVSSVQSAAPFGFEL
jgi:hypothetical protein